MKKEADCDRCLSDSNSTGRTDPVSVGGLHAVGFCDRLDPVAPIGYKAAC